MKAEPGEPPQIRVLVVDDSAFMRTALTRLINSDPALWVVNAVASGSEALEKIGALEPDVVTLDVDMPGLDGLETLRCIMARCPRPVIMVSSLTDQGAEATVTALCAGAFDYLPKQLCSTTLDIIHLREDLIAKIKTAAKSRATPSHSSVRRKPPGTAGRTGLGSPGLPPEIVSIGTSTGGPMALQEILPRLPVDLSVPILIVQHMPPGFTAPLAQRLDRLCKVSVREASHGEEIQPGVVYIAPAGQHLSVRRPTPTQNFIQLSDQPANKVHIPSIDVMMQSVAFAFGNHAMGIIMTGMGDDGAQGMQAIHRHGGFTLGQDEASCVVYGMPRACAEMGILQAVAPLSQIAEHILKATRYRKRA